ncbi:AEL_HP2_G0008460.mRNA.1.CDS.1 [Saccharomyces cerevisiae]|nr:AEL_HP2_G0008460.mRNA.1.CDS.1 [Saccharomyces cerevisiae]CAI6427133.1 AEL_HP2_G0008460.mRNA.1.CDS.1 [Saccharomyces cerevisiae]
MVDKIIILTTFCSRLDLNNTNVQVTQIRSISLKVRCEQQSMVFMARSRQERDLWVMSIYYELED